MTARTSRSDPRFDNEVLHVLCERAADRLDDVLDALGISLRSQGKRMIGRCPVHGGDSYSGFNLYPEGQEARGNWQCLSHKCESHFSRSLLGLVRGVLSHEKHGWAGEGDTRIGQREAVDWLCKTLDVDIHTIQVDRKAAARRSFRRDAGLFAAADLGVKPLCSREDFAIQMEIPAPYYIARGFRPDTLRTFEVGLCHRPRSRELGRVVFPVYDGHHKQIMGALSRSLLPQCGDCRLCHEGDCPSEDERHRYLRWRTVGEGFVDKHYVYNLGRARAAIKETRSVCIVEGAADVWRLEEAGLANAVALMGSEFGDRQQILLEECSLKHVFIMTDDDDAGHAVAEKIRKKFARICSSVTRLIPPAGCNDVGEMSVEFVHKHFVPTIDSRLGRNK